MSRGLGRRQVAILQVLVHSREPAMSVHAVVREAMRCLGTEVQDSASAMSSTRRALGTMRRRGLASARYHPRRQGQPRVWSITNQGLWELGLKLQFDASWRRHLQTCQQCMRVEQELARRRGWLRRSGL